MKAVGRCSYVEEVARSDGVGGVHSVDAERQRGLNPSQSDAVPAQIVEDSSRRRHDARLAGAEVDAYAHGTRVERHGTEVVRAGGQQQQTGGL